MDPGTWKKREGLREVWVQTFLYLKSCNPGSLQACQTACSALPGALSRLPGAGEPRGCPQEVSPLSGCPPPHTISGRLTAMVTTVRSAKAVITTFWRMFSCQVEQQMLAHLTSGWGLAWLLAQSPCDPKPSPAPYLGL